MKYELFQPFFKEFKKRFIIPALKNMEPTTNFKDCYGNDVNEYTEKIRLHSSDFDVFARKMDMLIEKADLGNEMLCNSIPTKFIYFYIWQHGVKEPMNEFLLHS